MVIVAKWPKSDGGNAYIHLFYRALLPYSVSVTDMNEVTNRWLADHAGEIDAIHLHMYPESIWRTSGPHWWQRLRALVGLARYLTAAKRRGLRILWTIHDIEHHEGSDFVDRLGYRLLARMVDLCICHDEWARKEFVRRYGSVRSGSLVVMKLGNYDGVFPAARLRADVQREFGIIPRTRTLLCCGGVRPYKGLEIAIDAVRALGAGYQLIIAGCPLQPHWGDELREQSRGLENVRFILRQLTNQEIADLHEAADCILLPYHKITGSAAILTAATFGRGVVATDLPFFRETLALEPEAGVLCAPGSPRSLAEAVEGFFLMPASNRYAAARRLADRLAWPEVIRPIGNWFQATFPRSRCETWTCCPPDLIGTSPIKDH